MTIDEFFQSEESTTVIFKKSTAVYSIEVIHLSIVIDKIYRIVVISLDKEPVLFAISSTILTNEFFLDLLLNNKKTPIGIQLFSNKDILRKALSYKRYSNITELLQEKDFKTNILNNYLLPYCNDENIAVRELSFTKQSLSGNGFENLLISEYALPALKSRLLSIEI